MAIGLRIVGIFYRTKVELAAGGTVKDVLDTAAAQITTGDTFSYEAVPKGGTLSPQSFRAFYESGFTSQASGLRYPSGTYELKEDLDARPAYTVWQYYIFDADNTFINRDKGFVPFDDAQKAFVKDGQSVIWRLVSVIAPPDYDKGAPRLYRELTS